MEIDMTTFYALGSLLLGIIAWIFAFFAIFSRHPIKSHRFSIVSFAMCALALLLQLLEVKKQVGIHAWDTLTDIIHALVLASCVLIGVAFVLNMIAVVKTIVTV